jgi:poly-gamma-glutamate synthesis protein (capsule biosynthesis protein)
MEAVPMRIERLRLNRATRQDSQWLRERLAHESERFGVSVGLRDDGALQVVW